MKKILILTFLFLIVLSCEKIDDLTKFQLQYETNFIIPDNIPEDTLVHLQETTLSILPDDFQDNNTSKDLLEEVILKKITVNLDDANENFDFIKNLAIYIAADDLPKVRIAWKNSIPDGEGNSLELDTLQDNILAYFKKESIKVFIDVETEQATDHNIPATAVFDFEINAKILGN